MGVVPEEIKGSGGKFIKTSQFEGEGLVLEVKGFEKIVADDPDFGANEKDYLLTSGRLSQGETFRYTFMLDGNEMMLDSKSATFFIAFSKADPATGDKISVKRTGSGKQTEYDIKIV